MANGKILQQIEKSYDEIDELLEKPKFRTKDALKGILRTNRLFMAFLAETFIDDHAKIQVMWPAYKFMVGVSSVMGVSIIGLIWALITGQAEIVIK